jgi:excisionase family DNA binding protein
MTTTIRPLAEAGATVSSLDGLPLMLTVAEAAEVLRVGRTTAYKLVELHRTSNGRTGLPHVRLGSRVMVRRVDLAEIVGVEPG